MNRRKNILVGLSVLPGLPLLIYGSSGVIHGMGHPTPSWVWVATATLFGFAGSAGLILASFAAGTRVLVTALVACAYLALVIAILGMYLTYREQQALLPPAVMGQPFPIVRLMLLLWMLTWPICAGIVAIRELWTDHS